MNDELRQAFAGIQNEISGLRRDMVAMESRMNATVATKEDLAMLAHSVNKRFDEQGVIFNEILNEIGGRLNKHDRRVARVEKRLAI